MDPQGLIVPLPPRILQTLCRKLKLPEEFDFQLLARLTPGYVGADLMALCREAVMSAVNRVLLRTDTGPNEAAGGLPEPPRDTATCPPPVSTEDADGTPVPDSGHDHLQV